MRINIEQRIKGLIRKGLTENAIYELQYLSTTILDKNHKKQIAKSGDLLLHNYRLTQWKYNMGLLAEENWSVFQAKIANAIIELIDELTIENYYNISDIITFSIIDIKNDICCWRNRDRQIDIENPIYDFHEEQTRGQLINKIEDPIFDITILNESTEPVILSHVGVLPISARHDIKGIPSAGKIQITEGYILKIEKFEFGQDVILKLDDPIYMEAKAPFRFTLILTDYRKKAISKGNDTVMKFIVNANAKRIESPFIKMGMF